MTNSIAFVAVMLSLCVAVGCAKKATPEEARKACSKWSAIQQAMAETMGRARSASEEPAMSVASSISIGPSLPVSSPTRTRLIASGSKPITAVAVRHLVEAGRLRLEEKVVDVLELKPVPGKVMDERLKKVTTLTATHSLVASGSGLFNITARAYKGLEMKADSAFYYIQPPVTTEDPPAGLKAGVNITGDNSATFMLYAPGKNNVFVLGDFNGWVFRDEGYMKKSSDGKWWKADSNATESAGSGGLGVAGSGSSSRR